MSEEEAFHLAGVSPLAHFESCAKVANAHTNRLERPKANVLQRRLAEAYDVLLAYGVEAIRIIVTKIRQCGGTTMSLEILYHLCMRKPTKVLIMADVKENAKVIVQRLEDFSTSDGFPWGVNLLPRAEIGRAHV